MYKTILRFPGGEEISSGISESIAVQNFSYESAVNVGHELSIGSVCASSVTIELFNPNGEFAVLPSSTFSVYRVDAENVEHLVGLFNAEKPTALSENRYSITAYDNIVKLDKDLTSWLNALVGWPYTALNFAQMVATECGLTLKNTSMLNGDYSIPKFQGQAVTGRKLMEWLGQIYAKFCRATPTGEIEFAWYTPKFNYEITPSAVHTEGTDYTVSYNNGTLSFESSNISVAHNNLEVTVDKGLVVVEDNSYGSVTLAIDDGTRIGLPFYMNSLTHEDYETALIKRVKIQLTENDVGIAYPQTEGNTYDITGNYLLTASSTSSLQSVAEYIYKALEHVHYTPCQVIIPANCFINAGDIVKVRSRSGRILTAYIMSKSQRGQLDVLRCTGSYKRNSPTATNNEFYKNLNGRMLEIYKSIEGLSIKASSLEESTRSQFAQVGLQSDTISATVSQHSESLQQTKEAISELKVAADGLSLIVDDVVANGVSQVRTSMGYTFNNEGLSIQKPGGEMVNLLNDIGMEVSRSGEIMLKADKDGVTATDVKVRNFLIVGEHARFENYSNGTDDKRTACFWV